MAASSFDHRLLPTSPLRGERSASTPMVWPGSRSTGGQNLITYETLQTRGDKKIFMEMKTLRRLSCDVLSCQMKSTLPRVRVAKDLPDTKLLEE